MDLDRFIQQVTDAVMGDNRDEDRDRDYNDRYENVRPASEDPYGDPADRVDYNNVRPASQDPYGDPADYGDFGNVRPASEDPYGDPADEENTW